MVREQSFLALRALSSSVRGWPGSVAFLRILPRAPRADAVAPPGGGTGDGAKAACSCEAERRYWRENLWGG